MQVILLRHLLSPGMRSSQQKRCMPVRKFAVRAIMEGLGKEMPSSIRTTSISPGAVATELTATITDEEVQDMFKNGPDMTPLESKDIAEAVFYAASQPASVNVNEIIVSPSHQG